MNRMSPFLVVVLAVGCGSPVVLAAQRPEPEASTLDVSAPEPQAPLREYFSCDALGDRRYDRTFCVRAERVHIEDHQFSICPSVMVNPAAELYDAIVENIREGLARVAGWEPSEVEFVNGEGLQAIVTLDACVRQRRAWSAEERRSTSDSIVIGDIDGSRTMQVELHAARGFSYRVPGRDREGGEVGVWPRPTVAPPIEWLGYTSCDALPERFTSPSVCVHAANVRGRGRALGLCDRVTALPTTRLTESIEARIADHLRVREHSDARVIDVILADRSEYVVTIDTCVALPESGRQARDARPARRVRGTIHPDRPLRVEVEQARFRFRFGAEGPFRQGSIGFE